MKKYYLKIALISFVLVLKQSFASSQEFSMKQQFKIISSHYQQNEKLIETLWHEIDSIYTEERRTYHNMVHLENFHYQLNLCKLLLKDYETAFMAMIYHDIVYFTTDGTNEEKSAELAKIRLMQLQFPEEKIEKCISMILATKRHEKNADQDINYFIDADMSILGLSIGVYDAYVNGILGEYGTGERFLNGRKRFLQGVLKQDRIFITDFFYNLYEKQSRLNIQREIDNI